MGATPGARGRIVPLSRTVWGMPGPVWTMVAWSALSCLLLAVSLLLPLTRGTGFPTVTTASAVILALSAAIGLVGRARLPQWWIYANTAIWIAVTCWLMWPSAPIEIAVLMFGFVICAMYVGSWMPRRAVTAFATAWVLGSLAVLVAQGHFAENALVWLTASAVSVALAFLLNSLTRFLERQALHDALTGLLNRSGLLATVSGPAWDAMRSARPLCIAVIDLDGFKVVNDQDGHLAGDAVLRAVGLALAEGLRDRDVVARFGGDEFVVLLPRTDAAEAELAIRRAGRAFPIRWSYGVAEWDPDQTIDDVLAAADARMYLMKQAHRST